MSTRGSDSSDGRDVNEDSWVSEGEAPEATSWEDGEVTVGTAPAEGDAEVEGLLDQEPVPEPPPVAPVEEPVAKTPPAAQPPRQFAKGAPSLANQNTFRAETMRLARARDYRGIAALHESAIATAPWAAADDLKATLLLELARLYRDRIADREGAQRAFAQLIEARPGHEEAMKFLSEAYEEQGNHAALHQLYASAVDDEWSPERRLELTGKAARIALDQLKDPQLAARDWERLLELGESDNQVTVELSRVYREAGRWTDLGEFLENRASSASGTMRVALLREAVEAFLAGGLDPSRPEALLQQILSESSDDPVALASLSTLLASAKRWDELADVARRQMPDVPGAARLDVLRLVADLLTRASEHERAAIAYERILQLAPSDKIAVQSREEHLRRVGDHQGLVTFLVARAEKNRQPAEKARLFARAAEVADQHLQDPATAASLWQRSVTAAPDNAAAYDALVAIHDRLGDTQGVTGALEGLARVTKEPKARARVLRRLGDHHAHRAHDDAQAQRCWLEVTSIDPDDLSVQRELNGIHKRRGDFAALDAALTRQLWRTTDREAAVELSREIAQNLDENLQQPERTVRAWMHVLDLSPSDDQALQVLVGKLLERQGTEVLGALETRLWLAGQAGDRAAQIEIGLQAAGQAEQREDRTAAIAAYERVRAWAPSDDAVLEPLVRLHGQQDAGAAVTVLEIAASQETDPVRATTLLSRALQLCAPEQPRSRFLLERRLLRLHGGKHLQDVVEAGAEAGAWSEIAALYQHLGRLAADEDIRGAFGQQLASICEKQLGNPVRAFVAMQSLGLSPLSDLDIQELERLAEATGRWEDLLAVLDATINAESPAEHVHRVLMRRADICEKRIEDPRRAFLELQRFVDARQPGPLSELETEILDRMRRLASDHQLYRELATVFDTLWDLSTSHEERVRFAREREAILRDQLGEAAAALDQALLVFRMIPQEPAVTDAILQAADQLGRWNQALPVLEGVWLANEPTAQRLATLANLYDQKCGNTQHAVELLAEALRLEPNDVSLQAALEQLADKGQLWSRVVEALRLAAGRVVGEPRGLDLARRVAALYADKLGDAAASLEVHRWILQVWPDELDSLQVVIDAHRANGEHADLRSALEQWIERTPDQQAHVPRWLEIGRLCRESLSDPAGALVAYSHVIEIDPANEEAADAMRGLGNVSLAPSLRRKQILVELARAAEPRKIELLGLLVAVEQELGDRDAAVAALREMAHLEGGRDAAFEPLARLLREASSWSELADLLESAAANGADSDARLRHLGDALAVSEAHLNDVEREERLLRKLLEANPSDDDAAVKLTRLLRNSRRFEELARELQARVDAGALSGDGWTSTWMRRELVRLYDLALDRSKDAESLLRVKSSGPRAAEIEADSALWLATMAQRRADHSQYIDLRRRHLARLPKRLGAMVLCHLAEYCDQNIKLKGRVLSLYREARTLDPDNSLATDALRGLGRGVKTWRSTAALLPVPDEETLTEQMRGEQLRFRGDDAKLRDPNEAIGWYERAVAAWPDDIEAWDAIATIALERKDLDYAWLASVEAELAFERTASPANADPAAMARRIGRTSEIAARTDHPEEARELAEIAFAIDPNVPASAALVADARFEAGDDAGALSLYDRILQDMASSLTPAQRAHAMFRCGALHLRAGDLDKAQESLRGALLVAPLLSPALDTMSDLLRKQAQPANAALHLLKALLVTREADSRGGLLRRIGELFETDLARPDEAGAWFEFAVEAGVSDSALQRRLLQHYRRTGRADQALTALEDLIQTSTDPAELADMWALRGSILAERDPEAAVEALDIALSYDPAHGTALASLRSVLEQRGDYAQLADLLDARTEAGTRPERIEALRALTRICFENLHDAARGEQYLLRLVELAPSRESIENLLRIVEADPSRSTERLPLIGRLLGFGPPYAERLIEAAHLAYDGGHKHWAWAILSALLGAAPVDPWTKSAVAELRKQFEKFDAVAGLKPFVVSAAGPLPEPTPFSSALLDLCARMWPAPSDDGLTGVDPRTGPGKVFERIQEGLGIQARLLRSADNAPPLAIHAGEVPTIAIRTDQLSAPAPELAWVATYGIMIARAECAALAPVPEGDRDLIVPALLAACEGNDAQGEDSPAAALGARIAEILSPEELAAWKNLLTDPAAAEIEAREAFSAAERAACRVALIAAGDLRTSARALARLAADSRRPPGVGKLDEFEAFFTTLPMIGWLFEYAVDEDFGRMLSASA